MPHIMVCRVRDSAQVSNLYLSPAAHAEQIDPYQGRVITWQTPALLIWPSTPCTVISMLRSMVPLELHLVQALRVTVGRAAGLSARCRRMPAAATHAFPLAWLRRRWSVASRRLHAPCKHTNIVITVIHLRLSFGASSLAGLISTCNALGMTCNPSEHGGGTLCVYAPKDPHWAG